MKNKIKPQIVGLDSLFDGFLSSSNILISGKPGSGKTIFSLEILFKNIYNNNLRGIYFTFEDKKEDIIFQIKNLFDKNIKQEISKNNFIIISLGFEESSNDYIKEIYSIIKSFKPDIVVFDSITTFSYFITENYENLNYLFLKKFLFQFFSKMKKLGNFITFYISQKDEKEIDLFLRSISDGIINLNYDDNNLNSRTISIPKMRRTKTQNKKLFFEITNSGIKIK